MTTTTPVLRAVKRDRVGTRYARRLRESGQLPAVVYGHEKEPISVAVDFAEAYPHFKAGEKVFQLEIEGEAADTCLLKALQFDHLGTTIVHADFTRVGMQERVDVRVPVRIVGEPVGLKVAGALLEHPSTQITIACRVTNIPDFVEIDITELEAGESFHARDIKLPGAEMELRSDDDAVVAKIEIRKKGVELEEEAAGGEAVEGAEGEAAAGAEETKDES
jgi:large subunit ribosomal protein L25